MKSIALIDCREVATSCNLTDVMATIPYTLLQSFSVIFSAFTELPNDVAYWVSIPYEEPTNYSQEFRWNCLPSHCSGAVNSLGNNLGKMPYLRKLDLSG